MKKDFPHLKFVIDKSDNAGCYHNEVLFAWKVNWSNQHLKLKFLETIFNERQSGKDQCDRDTATAKRQMQYHIDRGNNIENVDQMFKAMQSATALCGFTANVLAIKSKKYTKLTQIKNISKIHHIKYIYNNAGNEYHVWQFSGIGEGKKFEVKGCPLHLQMKRKFLFMMQETDLVQ